MSRVRYVEQDLEHLALREPRPFGVLVADVPWPFKDKLPGSGRGAGKHYPLLSLERIKSFPLPPLADDAALFLWRVGAFAEQAFDVIRAWGFRYRGAEIVWNKTTPCARCKGSGRIAARVHAEQLAIPQSVGSTWVYSHKGIALCPKCGGSGALPWFGMGRTVRNAHEVCLVATRGERAPKVLDRAVRSSFSAHVPKRGANGKGAHSAKPPEIFRIAERLFPGPYCELFARETRKGWMCLGDEIDPAGPAVSTPEEQACRSESDPDDSGAAASPPG